MKELRLKEVGQMCDEFVDALMPKAGRLVLLDLSDPSQSLSDEPLIALLKAASGVLQTLDLSGSDALTDALLTDGIREHARALRSLRLVGLPEITDEGVSTLFASGWANPALRYLDLSRNPELAGPALDALITHSATALRELNINGWKAAAKESLAKISTAKELRTLDVGWCREVDDFVIKDVLEGCAQLKEVKVFGCNRVSVSCPRRRGLVIRGVESHLV